MDGASVNGHDIQDLDRLKQEILAEVKKELLKTKNEIIEGEFFVMNCNLLMTFNQNVF